MKQYLISILCVLALAGCQSTPKRVAFETIDSTTDLVQDGFRAYGDYMRAQIAITRDLSNPVPVRREAMETFSEMRDKLPELQKFYEDYITVADEATVLLGIPGDAPPTEKIRKAANAVFNITNQFLP